MMKQKQNELFVDVYHANTIANDHINNIQSQLNSNISHFMGTIDHLSMYSQIIKITTRQTKNFGNLRIH